MKTALRPYTYLDTSGDTAMETFSLQVEDLDYKVSPEYSNFQTIVRFMIYTYSRNRILSNHIEGKTLLK